jgi:hypothetical protein
MFRWNKRTLHEFTFAQLEVSLNLKRGGRLHGKEHIQ